MNPVQNKAVEYRNLGLMDYQDAWDYQTELFKKSIQVKINNRNNNRRDLIPNYILFCSHPNVYTLGKSGDQNNLLIGDVERTSKGIDFYPINRGGDITYHGPGQIVVYPILDLENFVTDIHLYLRNLEEAVIRTLREYDIVADRIDGLTGVWLDAKGTNARKICALGVKTSRWVTMHGLAFNVNTDLSYYDYIIPCGISDKSVTSLNHELNHHVDQNTIELKLLTHMSDIFKMEIQYE